MFKCARCDQVIRASRYDETTQFAVQARHESRTGDLCSECTGDFYDFIEEDRD